MFSLLERLRSSVWFRARPRPCPAEPPLRLLDDDTIRSICDRAGTPALAGRFRHMSKVVERRTIGTPWLGDAQLGEMRFLHALADFVAPLRVLEIGPHGGGSTMALATGSGAPVTTVEILDPQGVGSLLGDLAAAELAQRLGVQIRFVHQPPGDFLGHNRERYDLVSISGRQLAAQTYADLVGVLGRLADGAIIVLRDYFAPGQASEGGPWQAIRQLRDQGVRIAARPVGKLPWLPPGKGSGTGLALIGPA